MEVKPVDYDEHERLAKEQKSKNETYLEVFKEELVEAGLKEKTIQNHLFNVDFYINEYLLRFETNKMEDGCGYEFDSVLGDFFIRKCMWSTPASIKTTAASLKKFYKSMSENGYIPKEKYTFFCEIIKENMEDWQLECKAYNTY